MEFHTAYNQDTTLPANLLGALRPGAGVVALPSVCRCTSRKSVDSTAIRSLAVAASMRRPVPVKHDRASR